MVRAFWMLGLSLCLILGSPPRGALAQEATLSDTREGYEFDLYYIIPETDEEIAVDEPILEEYFDELDEAVDDGPDLYLDDADLEQCIVPNDEEDDGPLTEEEIDSLESLFAEVDAGECDAETGCDLFSAAPESCGLDLAACCSLLDVYDSEYPLLEELIISSGVTEGGELDSGSELSGDEYFVYTTTAQQGATLDVHLGSADLPDSAPNCSEQQDMQKQLDKAKELVAKIAPLVKDTEYRFTLRIHYNRTQIFNTAKKITLTPHVFNQIVKRAVLQRHPNSAGKRRFCRYYNFLYPRMKSAIRSAEWPCGGDAMARNMLMQQAQSHMAKLLAQVREYLRVQGLNNVVDIVLVDDGACIQNGYVKVTANQGAFPPFTVTLAEIQEAIERVKELLAGIQ